MSSFKRRVTSKSSPSFIGTRPLPGPVPTYITSTGIPSLDDIFGDGLPLGCSQLILAPDVHSAYGDLLQKYFLAQGLASGQDIILVTSNPRDFVAETMWIPNHTSRSANVNQTEEEDEQPSKEQDEKIKIAWRYERMKQFQTTVAPSTEADDFCKVFDLTSRIPEEVIDTTISSGQLQLIDISQFGTADHLTHIALDKLTEILGKENADGSKKSLRLCFPSLGSPEWGDFESHELCYFLHTIQRLLRQHSHACASISLSPPLCSNAWGGNGWTDKLGWLSDACITLAAFSANPSLTSLFPLHHGFVHIHSLPSPYTLQPPSDKYSTLRGLSSSGENNLAFKCMRKRFVIETLHLDLEGGIGERRTTPATNATIMETESHHDHNHESKGLANVATTGRAAIEVQMEKVTLETVSSKGVEVVDSEPKPPAKKKAKKKVAFHSDRPDLYDF
ncbi:PAXNEB-domain-containing protein [Abortiporus biennis]|nr:PAXNEB-domain-containing protein [Abortiporus biennis]